MATSARKSFTASKKSADKKKLIEFDFVGETIKALPNVSGIITLEYLEGIQSDDDKDRAKAIRIYLENSFDKENLAKFNRIAKNPDNDIDLDVLLELLQWLMEKRADRPLEESSE